VAVVILILLRLFRKRRLVCFNYLLSDCHLRVEKDDLFSANQIIHLKPLIGAVAADELLRSNPFVFRIYPNFEQLEPATLDCRPGRTLRGCKLALESLLQLGVAQLVEWICRQCYRAYLRRKSHEWSTPEEVIMTRDVLKLHSFGHREKVLRQFRLRLEASLQAPGVESGLNPAEQDLEK
jgi:hypothetical protein